MKKAVAILLTLLSFAACGGEAPKVGKPQGASYQVASVASDPATSSLFIKITVKTPITEESVKQAAEEVIGQSKGQFKTITVQSYLSIDRPPVATSNFQDGVISHQFNPQAAPQKIPTH